MSSTEKPKEATEVVPQRKRSGSTAKRDKADERALGDRRAFLDATLQIGRWLLATLFILNGAAALATLNMNGLDPLIAVRASEVFVVGLTAAVVAGMAAFLVLLIGYGQADMKVRGWEDRKWYSTVEIVLALFGTLIFVVACWAVWASGSQFSDGVSIISAAKEKAATVQH